MDSTPDRVPATRLAVPYRAKDSPSLRSEFSHPDVVILLTLLSYYYNGLNNKELELAFEHLQRSDQATSEYQDWVKDSNGLELAFHQLAGVNLEDPAQCREKVYPCLRYAKSVVDYYLSHIVFPKEMMEFPHKLCASGWDVAETKATITTGFSGTNDSRYVLPLSMTQLDLQGHTNALVLENLLRPENSVQQIPPRNAGNSSTTDAETLVSAIVSMDLECRVILDVGAQILELNNLDVAKTWLSMRSRDNNVQAAVFCDDNDNLCVVDRNGAVERLRVSPFAARLDLCLVFLDEAHTRGIDLRLPLEYRAAVTLGPNLTKDRLVQGKSK